MQGLFGLTTSDDPTFNIGFVASAIETNLAVITASAPALRPLFRARDRGGWFPRFSVSPTKSTRDVESGEKKAVGWPSDTTSAPSPSTPGRFARKFGRGGNRGGRRGGRSGRGRGGAKKYEIRVRRSLDATPLRSRSPRGSEEETMTANGIMRVSDIQREIDGIVKEIAVSGAGTYTGVSRPGTAGRGSTRSKSSTTARSLTKKNPNANAATTNSNYYSTKAPSVPGSRESNMNNFRNTGFEFFMAAAAENDRTSIEQTTRSQNPERYYSESVYPDMDFDDRQNRDYSEERISKYGERRFGVVTPRGTTPTSRGWKDEEGGRPF